MTRDRRGESALIPTLLGHNRNRRELYSAAQHHLLIERMKPPCLAQTQSLLVSPRLKSFQENNGGARANRLDVYMYCSMCAAGHAHIWKYDSNMQRTYSHGEHVRSCMHAASSEAKLLCMRYICCMHACNARAGFDMDIHGGNVLFMSLCLRTF